jgi:hypothetical protein
LVKRKTAGGQKTDEGRLVSDDRRIKLKERVRMMAV